ncbi:MAG TPA: gamma-glutamylcyclotransferase family protein [Acidimicrobiia bacterium]
MIRRLFVYGTLMLGHEAWPLIEPYAEATVPTTVRGRLFDTGAGYPAAVFATDGPTITGSAVTLHATRVAHALDVLDRYEGPEYRRIVVDDDHGPLYAYEWIAARDSLIELPSGCWNAPI